MTFLVFIGYNFAPGFRAVINENQYAVQKADDATSYQTLKKVEDTCRAMISSYEADVLTWKQYKNSTGEQRSWADQAKMRANKTASTYNNYILENSYVWADNIPRDIRYKLEIVED
jgi:hypothetical protein